MTADKVYGCNRLVKNEEIFKELREAAIAGDEGKVRQLASNVLEKGVDPLEALDRGLIEGAKTVGDKFDTMEIFLADLIGAADAIKAGIDILLAQVPRERVPRRGTVVIGTVKGDIHDLGKNIVATLLKVHGFDVYDLGTDVPTSRFIEEAERVKADVIGLSALLTSTMVGQKEVLDYLNDAGKRGKYIVVIGGGPTNHDWAKEIGADGYAENAKDAVDLVTRLVKAKRG